MPRHFKAQGPDPPRGKEETRRGGEKRGERGGKNSRRRQRARPVRGGLGKGGKEGHLLQGKEKGEKGIPNASSDCSSRFPFCRSEKRGKKKKEEKNRKKKKGKKKSPPKSQCGGSDRGNSVNLGLDERGKKKKKKTKKKGDRIRRNCLDTRLICLAEVDKKKEKKKKREKGRWKKGKRGGGGKERRIFAGRPSNAKRGKKRGREKDLGGPLSRHIPQGGVEEGKKKKKRGAAVTALALLLSREKP